MLSAERWRIWRPHPAFGPNGNLSALFHDPETWDLVLRLRDWREEDTLELRFDHQIAYRNSDESFRNWPTNRDWGVSSFWRIEGSRWIRSLRHEALGRLDHVSLIHYAIFTDTDCLDIAAAWKPFVRINPPSEASRGARVPSSVGSAESGHPARSRGAGYRRHARGRSF